MFNVLVHLFLQHIFLWCKQDLTEWIKELPSWKKAFMSNSMTIEKVLCLIVGGQIANFGKKSPGHLIIIKK